MKFGFALSLALLAAGAAAHEYDLGKLTIGHPWAPASHGAAKTAAVYVTFVNDGPKSDRLLGVSSPIAAHAGLHTEEKMDGMMHMQQLPGIDIPAGQTVELKPGQMHIMLEGLQHPLKEGEMVPMTLTLANEGEVHVEIMVMGE
jgi:periplasmic copper chaperone A